MLFSNIQKIEQEAIEKDDQREEDRVLASLRKRRKTRTMLKLQLDEV